MIIDAHNHPDWLGYDFDKTIANMDECGIDRAVLLSWVCPKDEYDPEQTSLFPHSGGGDPVPFSACLDYARRAPGRFILGYAPDPRRPEATDMLEAAVGHYGVRICGELKLRMMYDNPDALRMFRFCGERGLPVVLHLDYPIATGCRYPRPDWWYGGDIATLERVLAACPQTLFLGHAPGFWAHISGGAQPLADSYPTGSVLPGGDIPRLLDAYPNLYCDVSAYSGLNALKRDITFARDFLIKYQDRVLYARDTFDNEHLTLLRSLPLPDGVFGKITERNAARITGG